VEAKEEEDDDEEWEAALQQWKSKTYALSVPLRVVALRGSFPPTWIKVWPFLLATGKTFPSLIHQLLCLLSER
jgi:hypothetical protein